MKRLRRIEAERDRHAPTAPGDEKAKDRSAGEGSAAPPTAIAVWEEKHAPLMLSLRSMEDAMATIDITKRAPHLQPSWFYSAGAAAAGVLVGFGLGMTIQSQTVALPAVAAPLAAQLPAPSMPSPVVQGAVALPVSDPAPGSMPELAPESEGMEPCWSDKTQVQC